MAQIQLQETIGGEEVFPVTILEAVYDGRTGLNARELIERIKPSEFSAATMEEIQSLFNEDE